MKRVTFSGEHKDIDEIIQFYNLCYDAIYSYKKQLVDTDRIPEEFIGLTKEEFELLFEKKLKDMDRMFSLELLSSIEANFRMDYLNRVYNRKKDSLSRTLREIFKEKSPRVSLEENILENWKSEYPAFKKYLSDYKGAIKYRNWLAHGRYWTPKLPKYDVFEVYTICRNMKEILINIERNRLLYE